MKVTLCKHIVTTMLSAASTDVWLQKEISLPFAPFPGLVVCDFRYEFEETIDEVSVNHETGKIRAWTQSIYVSQLSEEGRKAELDGFFSSGWKEME